jgi:hypothetical protein
MGRHARRLAHRAGSLTPHTPSAEECTMDLLQFTAMDYWLGFGSLVALTIDRWARGDWMPVHSEHVPTDFASLTINNVPIEVLYGPDAVRHPYKLSEPDETPPALLEQTAIFTPPPAGYFNADLALWKAADRLAARTAQPDPLRIITGL